MDAGEYPVLGLRSSSMPQIPGLTPYIERPSPTYRDKSPTTTRSPRNYTSAFASAFTSPLSSSVLVPSSPSLFGKRGDGPMSAGATPVAGMVMGAARGGGLGLGSVSGTSTPAKSPGKFERRLTRFDKSSVFSKYT